MQSSITPLFGREFIDKDEVEALNDRESEESGVFARATSDEIAKRKILKVKRPTTQASGDGASTSAFPNPFGTLPVPDTSKPANPFASFTGLLGAPSAAAPSKESIPAAASGSNGPFSFNAPVVAKTSASTTSGFSFAATSAASSSTSVTTTSGSKADSGNGSQESEYQKKMKKLNASVAAWMGRQMAEHPLSIWKDGLQDYVKYAGEITDKYGDQAQAQAQLSSTAASAIAKKGDAAPSAVSKPALSSTVSSSFPAFPPAKTSAPEAPKQEAAPLFSFGASAAAEPPKSTSAPAPFTFTLGAASTSSAASAAAPASAAPAPFGSFDKPVFPINDSVKSAPPSFPAFSLTGAGAGAAAAAPSSSSSTDEKKAAFNWNVPGLGSTTTSGQPAFGAPFSFASSGSGGFGGAAAGGFGGLSSTGAGAGAGAGGEGGEGGEGDDDEGEPILEPEKVYRNPEDKDEKLIECDSKMHRFDTSKAAGSSKGEWVEYGKGVFSITKCAETGKKRMLVRNLVGKIIFNASFYKGMKVDKTPKGQFSFGAVVDSSGTLKSFLLKVGEANRDKVLKIMKDAIAELD